MSVAVVVPTVGRPSLRRLLDTLDRPPAEVVVADDRPQATEPLSVPPWVRVVRSGGRGPAAARNAGWRATTAEWVVFVDDDVVVPDGWYERLLADLAGLGAEVAGSQARVRVPLSADRRPTDWERGTAGLATARWITAEMAYRRAALAFLGGFDERFRRAYREDADLALRALAAGYRLVRGEREVVHPVRPAGRWASVRQQKGNADDVLMARKHGPGWRARAGAGTGRRRWHLATVAAGGVGLVGRGRLGLTGRLAWAGLTGWFAWSRIAPGPRTAGEVATMLATSAAIPPVAVYHRLRGHRPHRRVPRWAPPPRAVLFDRDGTLVEDVPYNGDADRVRPLPGAKAALDRLRDRGIRLGVVTNQSGGGRGLLRPSDVDDVNARIDRLLGPFDTWVVCPHAPDDGCDCRKPAPGLIHKAVADLGVSTSDCVVVGDIGSDVRAALAAGARPILVPTAVTRPAEIVDAPCTARDLGAAVDLLLGGESP